MEHTVGARRRLQALVRFRLRYIVRVTEEALSARPGMLICMREEAPKPGHRASEEPSCASDQKIEAQPHKWPQREMAQSRASLWLSNVLMWKRQWPGAQIYRWFPFWLRPSSSSLQVSGPGPVCPPAGTGAAPPPHQPGVLALPHQAGTRQVSGRSQALHDSTSHTQAVWVC